MFENYGVQLYTLRDAVAQDLTGVLEAVANLGYGEVEGFGTLPLEPQLLRDLLERLNLTMPSSHVMLETLEADLEGTVAQARTLGWQYVVVPWIDGNQYRTRAQAEGLATRLEQVGQALVAQGLRLAYHHHDFELRPLEDAPETTLLELILERTSPETVLLELDVFWMWYAGRDPVAALRQYGQRICVVHLKDGERRDGEAHFLELGRGKLDFPAILHACEALGIAHRMVEQDSSDRDPLESVQISRAYLDAFGREPQ